VTEQGYPGVILRLAGAMNEIRKLSPEEELESRVVVQAGAGCTMAGLVSWCSRHGLSGLEFMAGIPGSVGGAVRMNAGAWGDAVGSRLQSIDCVAGDGLLLQVAVADLLLSYRRIALKGHDIEQLVITGVRFVLQPDAAADIQDRCRQYIAQRREKQPSGVASAGSFFKNPPGDSAGRLIEAAGLKGTCCGGAMVSPVHANFIVNTGGATADDIMALMGRVRQVVYSRFGVELEPEVQIFPESP
jgi:UDP-N-acetylmuramate dehydrogenase